MTFTYFASKTHVVREVKIVFWQVFVDFLELVLVVVLLRPLALLILFMIGQLTFVCCFPGPSSNLASFTLVQTSDLSFEARPLLSAQLVQQTGGFFNVFVGL